MEHSPPGLDVQVHPPLADHGSPSNGQACLQPSDAKLRKSPSFETNAPGTASFLQGASHFGIGQANINQRIDNLKVVTTINHFCSATGAGDEEHQSISLETSRTTTCAPGSSSSQFVATLNTPHRQLRFEYHRRETDLGHREKQVQLREIDIDLKQEDVSLAQREVALALREAEIHAKERVIEETAARADLITIFGIEGSKGIDHNLRNFALFEKEPGERVGRLLQLRTRFMPHHAGRSRAEMPYLNDTFKVTIARVVKTLHAEQQTTNRNLTFETIRANLAQSIFLESQPGRGTISRRAIKLSEGAPLPKFLAQSQWIIKLVEADEPESVLDSEISPPSSRRPKREKNCKFYFENHTDGGRKGPIDLVDLTVLTFPWVNVPRFKLSRLLLKCTISKADAFSTKKKADIVLDYQTHLYNLRDDIVGEVSPDARSRHTAYAYGLFSQ